MQIGQADQVRITTVMDNYADILLPSTDAVRRATPGIAQGDENRRLYAEHGLSLLVEVSSGETKQTILLDAGFSAEGVSHNLLALGLNLANVEKFVLSHGHSDHFAGLERLLEQKGMSVVLHPDAFSIREVRLRDGRVIKMPPLMEATLRRRGAELFITREPATLAPGVATTGEIPRLTDFELGMPNAFRLVDGEWVADSISDDQGLVINLRDKGLVIISGCAHAGIINTVRYAQLITGEDRVQAILGGFHLSGVGVEVLEQTIAEILTLDPALVVPMHCTGWAATRQFADVFPESFVLNAVGTTYVM